MNEINIARTIAKKRKEQSLTQEDLANYIGVTKASVSKWETGQSYLNLCIDSPAHFEEICKRTMEMIKLWNIKKLLPVMVIPFYYGAAAGYTAMGDTEKALDMLEEYVATATKGIFPIILRHDDFFDLIEVPQDNPPFGSAESPRDEKSIKQSLIDGIDSNPVFLPLHDNQRYQNLVTRIKNKLL